MTGAATLPPGQYGRNIYLQDATDQLDETHEGRLIRIAGRLIKFEPNALTLDDGTGPARVFFPAELPWRPPHTYVEIGEFCAVQGSWGSARSRRRGKAGTG